MSRINLNAKQELAVAARLAGKTYREAADESGLTEDHVKQLLSPGGRHPHVFEEYERRKAEMVDALGEDARRTLDGLLVELEEATDKAKGMLEFPSWIRAIVERAKLLGFNVDRKQIEANINANINATPPPMYDWDKLPLDLRLQIAEALDSITVDPKQLEGEV